MKSVLIVLAVAACATALPQSSPSGLPMVLSAPVAFRAPSHDSAIIQSHRLGGNFAYSTHEAHAFAVQSPIIGQRTIPVGVSYVQGTPVVKTSTQIVTQHVPRVGLAYSQVGALPTVAGIAPYAGVGHIPYSGVGPFPYAGLGPIPYAFSPAAVQTEGTSEGVIDTA